MDYNVSPTHWHLPEFLAAWADFLQNPKGNAKTQPCPTPNMSIRHPHSGHPNHCTSGKNTNYNCLKDDFLGAYY